MLNIINISGGIVILIGIILAVMGVRQCRKRISVEDGFISAEAEIVDMDSRISIVLVNLIPIIAKEYRPIIHFFTSDGREIQTSMPYAMKMSEECKELFQMYESHTAVTIRYNPKKPIEIYYRSKKGFRIREVIYKFFVSVILLFIGVMLIWGSFNI